MKVPSYVVTILSVIVFVLLFFEKNLGLNVTLFGALTTLLLVIFKRQFFSSSLNYIVSIGFLFSSVFYFLYGSPFILFVSIFSFVLLLGLHTQVPIKNLLSAIPNALPNYGDAFSMFFKSFRGRKRTKRKSIGLSRLLRIFFLPAFVILLFVALYSMGSSFFSDFVGSVSNFISTAYSKIANYIDIKVIGVGLVGLFISVIHSLGLTKTLISTTDEEKSDLLIRAKDNRLKRFKNLDLKYEYKSGVFLFCTLNIMLLVLLFLEIKNIWIDFEWQGEFLKSMVHEGTYVLIASILISMGVAMYYFRKNLNFYKNNGFLKELATVWISLNAVLIISVFVRNAYYIQHFALAYKRIGVVFFLVLCLIGLVTLLIKIYRFKSVHFVVRTNALAAYITLVVISAFNWDSIIAEYNFSHYKTAFIHLPFMSQLSDKALPYLKISDSQIEEIESKQVEKIPFAKRGYFKDVEYQLKIEKRITRFKKEKANEHWLEFVWAERKVLEKLNEF